VKKLGNYMIELIQFGSSFDEAQAHAMTLADERSIRFISPFNNSDVIAGQSTAFDEILLQAPEIEHLVISVGGGGLLSGALISRDAHARSDIRVTGVQPNESAALYHVLRVRRWRSGAPSDHRDGLAVVATTGRHQRSDRVARHPARTGAEIDIRRACAKRPRTTAS